MVYQIGTGADGSERRFLFVSQSFERLTGMAADAGWLSLEDSDALDTACRSCFVLIS